MDQRLIERFNLKYRKDDSGCWIWTASVAGKGYGQIKLPGQRKQIYAHRLSYMIHKGEDPGKKHICHTCDNPRCVNPEHLFIGTSQDNHDDMKAKGRHTFGEKSATVKLTEKQVEQIMDMLKANVPQTRIAKAFNVHQTTISKIHRKERWQHIK